MMPGVNQSAAGGLASDATSGTCPNCAILNQSLHEYVAALLTLKQKIIDTDRLLCEYKEKCDELQQSQRESAKLHKELDEVLLKLDPLEKQTAEYEAVKTELEETKATLNVYQVKSEELAALREENAKTLAINVKLQESIRTAEDAARTQNQERSKLRSDNAVLERDLQKTRESLRVSKEAVEEMENLKVQNAKALIVKGNLENQLLALEDTNLKQNQTIQDLKSKNSDLENGVALMEKKLAILEKAFTKDTKCSATQTENEPKVDKAKVWSLLQQVWQCVDPLSKTTENHNLNNNQCFLPRPSRSTPLPMPTGPFKNPTPRPTPKAAPESLTPDVKSALTATRSVSEDQKHKKMDRKKKRSLESVNLNESCVKTDQVRDLSPKKDGPDDRLLEVGHRSETPDVWEILSLSWSLPALLSPLPPDESLEMDVDTSLTEGLIPKTKEDKDTPQSTEPEPLKNGVAASSVHLSPENRPNKIKSPISSNSEDTSPQKVANETQVENMCEIQDDLKESPSPANSNHEQVNTDQSTVMKAESQLSTAKESQQCDELPQANCVGESAEHVKQVVIFEASPDKADNRVQPQTDVGANVPSYRLHVSVTSDSKTEPERTVEKIQSVPKVDDDQSSVLSLDSSDEDEFFSLKRKVRGGSLRPTDSEPGPANEKEECVSRIQETKCNHEGDHLRTENVNHDECVKDCSIIMNLCPEDNGHVDVTQEAGLVEKYAEEESDSLPVPDENNQQEEDTTRTEDCPAPSVNSNGLPLLDSQNEPTSTQSSESIGKVLSEMGPPLPPVVLPLTETPPKCLKHLNSNRPSLRLPSRSLAEGLLSPNKQPKIPSPDPVPQDQSLSVATPSPSRGVPSSPLQFGSATPKHALPVPGRLPSSALHPSTSSAPQENSMQILDTMYPELSAQARTLNILRGNVTLGRAAGENGASSPPLNPISGNKTINSSSTAFKKTEQKTKRIGANVLLPKSAKRLRLDTFSPTLTPPVQQLDDNKPSNDEAAPTIRPLAGPSGNSQAAEAERGTVDESQSVIKALEKLNGSCFDLLPVIRSHVFLGRISEIPVLRDEENSVISDFCLKQSAAEEFMLAVLSKIKEEKAVMRHELLQSYCRVYTGLCRWRGDCQKAHALVYSLLKEDFPEASKIILFMVTTWPDVLSHDSCLCRAVKVVSKLKAEAEISDFLSKYLHWEKEPPGDIHEMIPVLIKTLLDDDTLMFQKHERRGYDLCPAAWDYIFSLDLLCSHLGWKWTHDNIIGKELWPVMNTWVTQPRPQQTPVRDICVAVVLRLIGRLGQLGLKEKLCTSVQNVTKAINLFGKHGIQEGVPWEVQLSAVYTIYDLAPSNPKEALEALASWRAETTQPVPSAVTSCITQIGSVCRHIKP